jgi:hypothetical protein
MTPDELLARRWLEIDCRAEVIPPDLLQSLVRLLQQVRGGALADAASTCDRVSRGRPDNQFKDKPRAAYQAGACKAAYEIRKLAKELAEPR